VLRSAGVPQCDDVTNGRLQAKVLRLKSLHLMSTRGKSEAGAAAVQSLKRAAKAIRPVVKLELADHVALSALHSMQACLHMTSGTTTGGRAPIQAEFAVQHAGAAANVAAQHRKPAAHAATVAEAADELLFLATKLGESRLPLSAEQMRQHAHCIVQRRPAQPANIGRAPSSKRNESVFARLAAPATPTGSITLTGAGEIDFVCSDHLVVTKIVRGKAAANAGIEPGMQLSAFHFGSSHWELSRTEIKEFAIDRNGVRHQVSTTPASWASFLAMCKEGTAPWTMIFSPVVDQPDVDVKLSAGSPTRRKKQRSAHRRRRVAAPSPPPRIEQQPREFADLQITPATLGIAAGVSTFAADVDVNDVVDCSTSEVNQVLAWPQRKRAAVVRLQQQLLEARAVLAKHSGIGRLMGVLEAEALRKRTDSELDQQQQSAQPQPQPVADSGVAGGSQDGIQEEEAEGSGGVAAINVPNAEAAEEMSLLQSEVHKNDEQQRVNDEEQRELLDRVERLQKQLDTDKLDEAEQRKMIVEIRARAAQHGRSRSSPQTTMRAPDAGGGTRGVHPSAYTVLEKSLKQQDITLKESQRDDRSISTAQQAVGRVPSYYRISEALK